MKEAGAGFRVGRVEGARGVEICPPAVLLCCDSYCYLSFCLGCGYVVRLQFPYNSQVFPEVSLLLIWSGIKLMPLRSFFVTLPFLPRFRIMYTAFVQVQMATL